MLLGNLKIFTNNFVDFQSFSNYKTQLLFQISLKITLATKVALAPPFTPHAFAVEAAEPLEGPGPQAKVQVAVQAPLAFTLAQVKVARTFPPLEVQVEDALESRQRAPQVQGEGEGENAARPGPVEGAGAEVQGKRTVNTYNKGLVVFKV